MVVGEADVVGVVGHTRGVDQQAVELFAVGWVLHAVGRSGLCRGFLELVLHEGLHFVFIIEGEGCWGFQNHHHVVKVDAHFVCEFKPTVTCVG